MFLQMYQFSSTVVTFKSDKTVRVYEVVLHFLQSSVTSAS